MKASEKFRFTRNSPVGYIAKYYCDVCLGNLANASVGDFIEEIKTGKTPSKSNHRFYESEDFNWFKPDEIGLSIYIENAREKVSKFAVSSNQVSIFKAKTVLINCIGDIGRVAILKKESSANQQITGILFNEKVLPEYAYYYFLSHRELMEDDASSTTLPIINQKKLLTVPFKKPELKEQKKIVELLNYCWECLDQGLFPNFDRFQLDKDFKKQCKVFFEIHYKQDELEKEFEFQQTHLQQLHKAILQEAVQGELTKQNKDDEPADKLFQRIQVEKQKLIAAGKLKKEKELPPITEDEIPFELPKSWVWCKLGQVGNIMDGAIIDGPFGTSIDVKKDYLSEGIPVIRMMNIKPYRFLADELKFVSKKKFGELSRYNIQPNDILFSKVGAGIGESCIVPQTFKIGMISTTGVTRFRVGQVVVPSYLCHFLNSYKSEFIRLSSITAQPFLNMSTIKNVIFPLPPLSEQQRIVTKVEQLMQMVNELEKQVEQSQEHAEQLLQAVLKEAFSNKAKEYPMNEVVTMAAESVNLGKGAQNC